MFNIFKSLFKDNAHVGEIDEPKEYFRQYPVAVIDSVLKLNNMNGVSDSDIDYVNYVGLAIKGSFGKIQRRFLMPLYVRSAIISYDTDPEFSEKQAIKARSLIVKSKKKVYSRHDIMLFYCVLARLYAFQGNAASCIIALNQLSHCLLDCDMTHPTVKGIERRSRVFMEIICKTRQGSYIDAAASLVSPSDITDLVSVDKLYKVLHVAFHNKKGTTTRLSKGRKNRDILYNKLVDKYYALEDPICGKFERGNPEHRTVCVNEFLTIYTNEPRRAYVTEEQMCEVEAQYPEITFRRNNLKFIKIDN